MSRITKRADNRICFDCADDAGRLRQTILGENFVDERRVRERHDAISRAPVCGVCGLEKTHSFEFVEEPKVVYRIPLIQTVLLSAGVGALVAVITSIGFLLAMFYFNLLDKWF